MDRENVMEKCATIRPPLLVVMFVIAGSALIAPTCSAINELNSPTWRKRLTTGYKVHSQEELDKLPSSATDVLVSTWTEDIDLSRFHQLRCLEVRGGDWGDETADPVVTGVSVSLVELRLYVADLSLKRLNQTISPLKSLVVLEIECLQLACDSDSGGEQLRSLNRLSVDAKYVTKQVTLPYGDAKNSVTGLEKFLAPMVHAEALAELRLNAPIVSVPVIKQIAALPTLKVIGGTALTNHCLEALADVDSGVNAVLIERNENVTDTGLKHLARLPSLHSLNIAGCRCVGDYGIPALADIKGLTWLDISVDPKEYDEWLKGWQTKYPTYRKETREAPRTFRLLDHDYLIQLGNIKSLRTLIAWGMITFDTRLVSSIVTSLENLEVLDLTGCTRRDGKDPSKRPADRVLGDAPALEFLSTHKHLKTVILDSWGGGTSPVTDEAVLAMSRSESIQSISMNGADLLTAKTLKSLQGMKQLRVLSLLSVTTSDSLGEALLKLPQLEELSINATGSNDLDLPKMLDEIHLRCLRLAVMGLDADLIEALKHSGLEELTIVSYKPVPAAEITSVVKTLKTLRRVTMWVEPARLEGVRDNTPSNEIRKDIAQARPEVTLRLN